MKCPKCGHEFEIENNLEEARGESQKKGMIKKFSEGRHMSRAPFGYEWDLREKILIPAQNSREVEEIFEEFLQPDINFSILADKHKLSVNGLKKILRNFAYVGKVKFSGQIHEGKHKPLVSTTLFNHVQNKLDELKRKKN
ncbi:MAG: recombinase family protein [Nanobdellota archaeon]